MNFTTPPSTPIKNTRSTSNSSEPSTRSSARKKNAVEHTAKQIATQLTNEKATNIVPQLPATAPNKQFRLDNNDIQTFTKGALVYRADDSYNDSQQQTYKAQFFALNKVAAKNTYGNVLLEFKLLENVNLLRLDQNVDGFKKWLDSSSESEEDKNILHNNFGYPKPEDAPNIERKRDSAGDADRKMLKMIQSYATANELEIHGYYNDVMIKDDGAKSESGPSKFHAELAVITSSVFDIPVILTPDADIKKFNDDALLIRHGKAVKAAKRKSQEEISRLKKEENRNDIPNVKKRFTGKALF